MDGDSKTSDTTVNTVSFGQDDEHRKVALSPLNNQIVKNVNLVYYACDVVMEPHSHSTAQFSTLVSGQSRETLSGKTLENQLGAAQFKPIDFEHSNKIGPYGAMLLSININAENEAFKDEFGNIGWNLGDTTSSQGLWKTLCNLTLSPASSLTVDLEEITLGLLSGVLPYAGKVKIPPGWLVHAQQALHECNMSVTEIARNTGVHRVHLTRVFQAHFGVSVTQYRQRLALQKGISGILSQKQSTATAANEAGFSDQSHFSRVMKKHFDLTPLKLRSLFSK